MKQSIVIVAIICFFQYTSAQTADHIVISEFTTQGPISGTDEFVELYNPTLIDLPIENWHLQYKTSSGWIDKAVLPTAAVIPAHGFYLIANEDFRGPNTPDYTSSLWTSLSGIAVNGSFRVLDDSLHEIDKAGYGSSTDAEGAPAPNMGSAPSNASIERKAFFTSTADSLAAGGLHYLSGNGYDSDNNVNDFVLQTHGRNPQNTQNVPEPAFGIGGNGTGSVYVAPLWVYNNTIDTLTFTMAGDAGYTLSQIKIVIPQSWSWSHSLSDVGLTGAGFSSSVLSVVSDTIIVDSCQVTNSNIGMLTVYGIVSPPTHAVSVFRCITGVGSGTPAQILSQPSVKVNEVVPIINVHVNDSQGVQTPPYGTGSVVSISGTVTANFSSTQTNVFIQDATAAVDLFSSSMPMVFHIGDSIVVTGSIVQFRGLCEVSPDFSTLRVLATGRPVPEPLVLTCADVNATFQPDNTEPNEGRLVRINSVSYNPNSTPPSITDATGSTEIFIPNTFPPTPSVFDVIGILKQFKPGTSPPPPYTQNYEIAPRVPQDIIPHPGPIFITAPVEDSIHSTSIRITWNTDVLSTSMVLFGTSTYTDTVNDSAMVINHAVLLGGLTPATIYHYAIASADSNGLSVVGGFLFSSASPPSSTGRMNVYFNKSVDTTVALSEKAQGNVDLTSAFVERINVARASVDACFYNLSGATGSAIANALIDAKNRGVVVRVIGEQDNFFNAPYSALSANGIPVISDAFDLSNAGLGLMHNKFAVIDYKGNAPESVWVWTGSWNPTDEGEFYDRQNSIEIQDEALAGAYTAEFNEMWGSSTVTPNQSLSRFGARKTNNTPHRFNIAGRFVQSYFSPSDRTTSHIAGALGNAQRSICTAMYTFTRNDLADSMVVAKNRGRKVRAVLDNGTDPGDQYSFLFSSGVDVHLKGFSGGLLHHKYSIIDAAPRGADPVVITGSHNWTSAAENSNNENTLIIQDDRIANLYLQEFAARYKEAGGTDAIVLSVEQKNTQVPAAYVLSQNYPNPFNPTTRISFAISRLSFVSLKVFDVLGREVARLVNETLNAGTYDVQFDAGTFSSGLYFYELNAETFHDVKKMVLIK